MKRALCKNVVNDPEPERCEYLLSLQLLSLARPLQSYVRSERSFLMSSYQHPVYRGCQQKILFSNFPHCLPQHISELLRLADEELNNLMLFWLLLRVSTGVNKQLICSFCPRGQRVVIRRWADYFITYLTFSSVTISSPLQSGTQLGLSAGEENTIISFHSAGLWPDWMFGKKMTWESRDKLNKVRCGPPCWQCQD